MCGHDINPLAQANLVTSRVSQLTSGLVDAQDLLTRATTDIEVPLTYTLKKPPPRPKSYCRLDTICNAALRLVWLAAVVIHKMAPTTYGDVLSLVSTRIYAFAAVQLFRLFTIVCVVFGCVTLVGYQLSAWFFFAFVLFLLSSLARVIPDAKAYVDKTVIAGRLVRIVLAELANHASSCLAAHHTFTDFDYYVTPLRDEDAAAFRDRDLAYKLEARTTGTNVYGKNTLAVITTFVRSMIIVVILLVSPENGSIASAVNFLLTHVASVFTDFDTLTDFHETYRDRQWTRKTTQARGSRSNSVESTCTTTTSSTDPPADELVDPVISETHQSSNQAPAEVPVDGFFVRWRLFVAASIALLSWPAACVLAPGLTMAMASFAAGTGLATSASAMVVTAGTTVIGGAAAATEAAFSYSLATFMIGASGVYWIAGGIRRLLAAERQRYNVAASVAQRRAADQLVSAGHVHRWFVENCANTYTLGNYDRLFLERFNLASIADRAHVAAYLNSHCREARTAGGDFATSLFHDRIVAAEQDCEEHSTLDKAYAWVTALTSGKPRAVIGSTVVGISVMIGLYFVISRLRSSTNPVERPVIDESCTGDNRQLAWYKRAIQSLYPSKQELLVKAGVQVDTLVPPALESGETCSTTNPITPQLDEVVSSDEEVEDSDTTPVRLSTWRRFVDVIGHNYRKLIDQQSLLYADLAARVRFAKSFFKSVGVDQVDFDGSQDLPTDFVQSIESRRSALTLASRISRERKLEAKGKQRTNRALRSRLTTNARQAPKGFAKRYKDAVYWTWYNEEDDDDEWGFDLDDLDDEAAWDAYLGDEHYPKDMLNIDEDRAARDYADDYNDRIDEIYDIIPGADSHHHITPDQARQRMGSGHAGKRAFRRTNNTHVPGPVLEKNNDIIRGRRRNKRNRKQTLEAASIVNGGAYEAFIQRLAPYVVFCSDSPASYDEALTAQYRVGLGDLVRDACGNTRLIAQAHVIKASRFFIIPFSTNYKGAHFQVFPTSEIDKWNSIVFSDILDGDQVLFTLPGKWTHVSANKYGNYSVVSRDYKATCALNLLSWTQNAYVNTPTPVNAEHGGDMMHVASTVHGDCGSRLIDCGTLRIVGIHTYANLGVAGKSVNFCVRLSPSLVEHLNSTGPAAGSQPSLQ